MTTKICTDPCGLEKDVGEFYNNNGHCKKCKINYRQKYLRRTNGTNYKSYFKMLIIRAKLCASIRKSKGREDAGICTLTVKDVMDIHEKQKGLCYYSGIPYTCKIKSDWKSSLERLDPSKGLTVPIFVYKPLSFFYIFKKMSTVDIGEEDTYKYSYGVNDTFDDPI